MTRNNRCIVAVFVAGLAAGAGAGENEKMTAGEIVERANYTAYYQGADGRARVTMTIVDDQGRERNRELSILRYDDAEKKVADDKSFTGDQKFYVYFYRPADVDKMSYLVHKHTDVGTEDDRWLYLPKVDLVKRIAGSEKRTSFVGSNFFYEDISGRNPKLDTHELAGTTKSYYVLKSTPKKPDDVEFAWFKTWIHKDTFLVVKNEYYDDKGRAYRRYEAKKVDKIDGFWTVLKARMTDLLAKRYTDVVYENVKYNAGIPEDIFTERYLRRPPAKYLAKE